MSIGLAIVVFVGSLILSAVSSIVLSEGLDRVSSRLGFSEGLQGIVTALAADAPEIAAAVAALMAGSSEMGTGIVLGSNIFNLAALLGLSAVVAGRVRVSRQGLLLNGVTAVAVTGVTVALICGVLGGWAAATIVAAILVPYAMVSSLRPRQIDWVLSDGFVRRFLDEAVRGGHRDNRKDRTAPHARWRDMLSIVPALSSVVLASFGLVYSAKRLGGAAGVPQAVIGMLVLATLTGVPNIIAAVRLALARRGSAVLSESLNSNSINIVAGICLPAVLVGLGPPAHQTVMAAWWLLGATVATVTLACFRGGLRRWEGAAVIGSYAGFVCTVLWLA